MIENKWLYSGEFREMKGIILESRGGAKISTSQRNPDYKLLLQYALETLKNAEAKNVEIYIASNGKTKYPNVSDRLLSFDGVSKIDFTQVEIDNFITKLSKEIRLSGQNGTEKGGNSTKRLFFHKSQNEARILSTASLATQEQKTTDSIKEQVLKALESFSFDFKRPKKNNADLRILVTELQNNLKNHLQTCLTNFAWQLEYKANPDRKDSFDIYGFDIATDRNIVIELDPHRADSIAKKFVSRLALMVNHNLLYVAYLYPGTDNMPKNEANKYLLDCEAIMDVLDTNAKVRKEFLGIYLTE